MPFIVLFDIKVEYSNRGIVKEYHYWKSFKMFMIKNEFYKILSEF
jgi:hypothetical protein